MFCWWNSVGRCLEAYIDIYSAAAFLVDKGSQLSSLWVQEMEAKEDPNQLLNPVMEFQLTVL